MTPRERLFALEQFGIKLGLDNVTRILDAMGRPDRAWTPVHIAGTNGKGSVAAMVERGLRAAGHRTGRYTSPHLSDIEERIAIDGSPISPAMFDTLATDTLEVVDRLREAGTLPALPTFFEVTTAMAFEAFRRSGVTVGVVEVGLGGRFDATNVIMPVASVITSIAFDHERHLGTTLAAIAGEKAGIVKRGVPLVIGDLPAAAREVVVATAAAAGAPLVAAGAQHVTRSRMEAGRATLTIHTPSGRYADVTLALKGAHQIGNAVVAARTLEVCHESGIEVEPAHIVTGLSDAEWPARLEWLRLENGGLVLIDAAHNPAGAQALTDYLVAAQSYPLPLVIALMKDKDVDRIIGALAPVISQFVATEVGSDRSLPAVALAERIGTIAPAAHVIARSDPEQALTAALSDERRAVVAGSIFLSGPMRARLLAAGATRVDGP